MKKILSYVLALALLCTVCAYAADSGKFLHGETYGFAEGNELVVTGADMPEGGDFSVTLGSKKDTQFKATTVGEAGLTTTVYCIVDTSNQTALERNVRVLKAISALMKDGDLMVISRLGAEISEGDPLTTPAQRDTAIAALSFEPRVKTNLYEAVKKGMESLATNRNYTFNRCMLVLSDGVNDGSSSVTEAMATEAIGKTTLALFAAGTRDDYLYMRAASQTMERMVMESVGGQFYEVSAAKEAVAPEMAASEIWKHIQSSVALFVNTEGLDLSAAGDKVLLTVRYVTKDSRYEDSASILTADLKDNAPKPTEAPAAEEEPAEEEPAEEKGTNWVLIGGIGALVLAVIVIAVVLAAKKKKQQPEAQQLSVPEPVEPTKGSDVVVSSVPFTPPADIPSVAEFEFTGEKTVSAPIGPELLVHLTVIGHSEQTFDFTLPENQARTLGRDASRSDIALLIGGEADRNLSGCHCELQWTGGSLYIADKKSTNGTFVNGAPVIIGALQQLNDQDTLRIGSREYRVTLTEKN